MKITTTVLFLLSTALLYAQERAIHCDLEAKKAETFPSSNQNAFIISSDEDQILQKIEAGTPTLFTQSEVIDSDTQVRFPVKNWTTMRLNLFADVIDRDGNKTSLVPNVDFAIDCEKREIILLNPKFLVVGNKLEFLYTMVP